MDDKLVEELLKLTLIGSPKHTKGTRPVHSFGIGAHGTFRGSTDAQRYCGAEQFSTGVTPVVVRFSNSQGQDNPEGEPQIRGMAVKFFNHAMHFGTWHELEPLGSQAIEEVDMVCSGLPNFFAVEPEPLARLFKALKPQKVDPPTRLQRILANLRLNPLPQPAVEVKESAEAAVLQWAKENPRSHAAVASLGLNATQPPPASFGRLSYHSVHAFNMSGADKSRHCGRFSFEPVLGVRDAAKGGGSRSGGEYDYLRPRYLTEELQNRLRPATIISDMPLLRFTLRMTLADPGDDPSDPTVVWPSNRRQVIMGTLDLVQALYDDPHVEKLSFNPGRLAERHMWPTDDELLKTRIAVYRRSQERRDANLGDNYCVFDWS